MVSYIERNLLPGEKIIYFGHRHWVVFSRPMMWIITAALIYLLLNIHIVFIWMLALAIFAIGVIQGLIALIDYTMSEIDVTTERVLIKIGWLARISIETDLRRIASIDVEQSLWGRIFNYGTVIVCDVGNARTPFEVIKGPFVFRRAVLIEIERIRKGGLETGESESGKGMTTSALERQEESEQRNV